MVLTTTISSLIITLLFLCSGHNVGVAAVNRSPCAFLADAPAVDIEISAVRPKLQFLDVDAKVYRKTLAAGSKPKIHFVRYSSTPTVELQGDRILISTKDSGCVSNSAASLSGMTNALLKTLVTSSITAGFIASNGALSLPSLSILLITALYSFPEDALAASDCTPSMEIVLEAPPYYLGSVEECLRSVSNPDHCPEPFPQFHQCSDVAPSCKLAVVGAGTGGLYTAYRLVEEGVFEGSDVCIFEATDRVGGRLYSLRGFGPEGDITVDAGAYRTWPNYTPTTHAVITDMLGFKMECYDDDDPCLKFNIVGDKGQKIGFATFVEELMSRLIDKGICFFQRHNLISIVHNEHDGTNTLSFSNGVSTTPSHSTILNIPQRSLLEVVRESDLFSSSGMEEAKHTFDSLHSVQTEIVTKLYLYYEDAWWIKAGLTAGDFEQPGDARNMLLQGRYHDGDVKCTTDEDGDKKCYGFLLAVYSHDFSGAKAQYFRRFQRDRPEPVTILSNTNPEDEEFLKHAHEQIVNYHIYGENAAEVLNATSYSSQFQFRKVMESIEPPTFAVLANWNTASFGAGGGWHHWTELSLVDKAMKPMNELNLHVVNEAFSKVQGWAEGSLLLADEILEEHYGVARPWDFDVPDGVFYLAQTSSEECVAAEESGSSSGGGSDGGTNGGELDLCFAAGSLVELGDGSLIPIEDVQTGDSVATGVNGKIGLVTEKLVHSVENGDFFSDVVVIPTKYGELVGTPDHPVLLLAPNKTGEGDVLQWMELGDALNANLLKDARRESRVVDVFYNLEIDGHQPGESAHSYVVNGMVASGLGDSPILNEMFPRQTIFKEKHELREVNNVAQ